jgi:hypothetical protein
MSGFITPSASAFMVTSMTSVCSASGMAASQVSIQKPRYTTWQAGEGARQGRVEEGGWVAACVWRWAGAGGGSARWAVGGPRLLVPRRLDPAVWRAPG